jgi:hypothetical protein
MWQGELAKGQIQMCYRILLVILFMTYPGNPLLAQWTKSVSVSGTYDDNAFRNHAGEPDYITDISGYLSGDHKRNQWRSRVYYRASYHLFANNNDRNFHYHRIGIAYSRTISDRGNSLNLGINSSLRANRPIYNYYNLRDVAAFGNIKIAAGSSSTFNLGYRLRGRWYTKLSDLNYSEHYFFGRISHFFKSRTTVILGSNFGRKTYRHPLYIEDDGSGSGQANDDGTMGGYGHHQGGRGHMGGSQFSQVDPSSGSRTRVSQWITEVRLAQSLTHATGISLAYTFRRNPDGVIRYLAGQVSGYVSEDELFDDHYGYESNELAALLTQVLPSKITVKAGADVRWKNYIERMALDLSGEFLSGGPLREDRRLQFRLSLGKKFTLAGGRSLNLIAESYWIDNHSNDMYYDYRARTVSLAAGMSL